MTRVLPILILATSLLLSVTAGATTDRAYSEVKCPGSSSRSFGSSSLCLSSEDNSSLGDSDGSLPLLLSPWWQQAAAPDTPPGAPPREKLTAHATSTIHVYFFWGRGCPHCEKGRQFLDHLKRRHPALEIKSYEVWYNRQNARLLAKLLLAHGERSSGVPVTFIHGQVFTGFNDQTRGLLENTIQACAITPCIDPAALLEHPDLPMHAAPRPPSIPTAAPQAATRGGIPISIPILGDLTDQSPSLPVLTIVIAGLDSFNPCAFFVLLTLLGLLVHAQSRNKMLLIGGIYVFFSGFIYLLFMAAWLNLFLVMGHVALITKIAGAVSLVVAAINIKDFFLFKQGLSLSIPDSAKPRLFERMRALLRTTSFASILVGTTVLAVIANFYELLCTAGFPLVFTRILTLHNLTTTSYYLYLVLYNMVYVIPLLTIVIGFTLTLGRRKLSEWQGRMLKLMSGVMMLGLGSVLLVNPALLNSATVSFLILLIAISTSLFLAKLTKTNQRGQ